MKKKYIINEILCVVFVLNVVLKRKNVKNTVFGRICYIVIA